MRVALATVALLCCAEQVQAQPVRVPSCPDTVVRGEIPIDRPPVVTVMPGQLVRIDTLSHQGATQDQDPVAYLGGMKLRTVIVR